MQKPFTPEVVVAYAHCPRKAFLLLCTDECGTPHDYPCVIAQQRRVNQTNYIDAFKQEHPNAASYDGRLPDAGQSVLLAATLRTQDFEAYCDVLTPVGRSASTRGRRYEPIIVVGTHTIMKEQQLELLFVGYVLGQLQQALPLAGTVVGLGGHIHRVPLDKRYALLDPMISVFRAWKSASSAASPPVILNTHCPQCPFRMECAAQAERDDDLSLLERITPKARQRYHDRGIFTVRQLSYLFKPRRRKRTPKGTRAAPTRTASVGTPHRQDLSARAARTD